MISVVRLPEENNGFAWLPGAGSWSVPSLGRRAFGDWPRTMNGCRRP
ncbi:MAG: hypothetical protein AVDCRST_MAG93-1943 [uncultured Chloroflexia bacterium]|uniref:Uncharacterized protein n=1 Tax=uncultured Chloroflexia bacterium TaxID=1672391 RepID=A0A6J4IKI8_9CHLR|nr:MAG: hypothetical protein AVDCRST_MAG93-1943 [uncultured Chloroflexia bacterium]